MSGYVVTNIRGARFEWRDLIVEPKTESYYTLNVTAYLQNEIIMVKQHSLLFFIYLIK